MRESDHHEQTREADDGSSSARRLATAKAIEGETPDDRSSTERKRTIAQAHEAG